MIDGALPDIAARTWAALSFRAGYNAAVVLAGAALLGIAAGVVGTFIFLRGRAMVSDALSHATLPGVVLAFMAGAALGLPGRNLPLLLTGAVVTGALAVLLVHLVTRHTRLGEDAAIGAVLSVSFGLGVVLLSIAQGMDTGGQAGLATFILGQTAGMTRDEAMVMAVLALLSILVAGALFKEFRLVCFDPDFARGLGWPVARIDAAMLALMVVVTVAGLQTVGLVLIVAFLIIPPVAARFWSDRLPKILVLAGAFGGASGLIGAALSSALPDLPAGGVIVLVAGSVFLISLLFAPRRGIVATAVRLGLVGVRLGAVKALADAVRGVPHPTSPVVAAWLRLRGLIDGTGRLTPRGRGVAVRAERNLRLWELLTRTDPHAVPDDALWGVEPVERVLTPDARLRLEAVDGGSVAPRGRAP